MENELHVRSMEATAKRKTNVRRRWGFKCKLMSNLFMYDFIGRDCCYAFYVKKLFMQEMNILRASGCSKHRVAHCNIRAIFFPMINSQFDGNMSTMESFRSVQETDCALNTTQYCFLHDDFFLVKGFRNFNLFAGCFDN